jgi:hypothetical protein
VHEDEDEHEHEHGGDDGLSECTISSALFKDLLDKFSSILK